jgi:lipopolysaccharide biosynthesis regulator YciM
LIKNFLRTSATEENIALAEKAVQKALAIDPSLPLAHIAQARICRAKGDNRGALKACNAALGRDRRFRAKPCKKIVDGQAASPSSWKMPRIAAWMV